MVDVRQRVQLDARRVERAGSLVMLLGVALGGLAVLGAAGAAVVSKNEVPVKAAIGLGGVIYGVLVAFVMVVQGLVLRTFGGYVQLRSEDLAPSAPARTRTNPAATAAGAAPTRTTDKKPVRPANAPTTSAAAPAPAARAGGVAVAKPTASGLRPPVKTS